jgi:hypothetical protein
MFGRLFGKFLGSFFPFLITPLFAFGASAQQPPATVSARECGQMAQGYVVERLAVWQKRLKLDDWKISILMAHPSDLKPKTLGNIHWDADTKSAVIRVLNASDYQLGCHDMLDDMEFTVVHELIHLELSSLPRSEASRRDEEYAVNQIADALLALDRHK